MCMHLYINYPSFNQSVTFLKGLTIHCGVCRLQMSNRYMKKYPLIIRIKATMNYQRTLVRMTAIKNTRDKKYW